ncbi:MAG: ankyrin repeat domain-containing protein [Vicinamibacterales bacterium]
MSALVLLVLWAWPADAAREVPLVEAARNLDTQAVQDLLDRSADVNAPAVDGSTALHWAVHRGANELVDLLIDAGADVTVANRYGVRPLSLASVIGRADVIERLLEAGANPNTSLPGGETALMTAARTGVAAAIRVLVAHGADVNARDEIHGQTAMMWAAARGNAEAIHVLAEVGGDVHARTERRVQTPGGSYSGRPNLMKSPDPTGFTPVMFAVRAGHLDAVRVLLEAGANVNDTLSDGQSVLVVATANANWELADYLLDKGADPNRAGAGWNALHQTVRTRRMNLNFGLPGPIPSGTVDSVDVIKKMLAKGVDVNARMTRNGMKDGQRNRFNRLGATAFLLAAKITDVEAMKILLEAGADPNIKSAENTTPLMVAAGVDIWNPGEDGGSLTGQEDEVLEAVRMCVALGNDVNAVNDLGVTALHGAAYRGVNIVAEYLVEQGAKLDARDTNGWIPWAIAHGFSYSNFYKAQAHTAALLAGYMEERGLSTEDETIPGSVCFDCQTRAGYVQSELERDIRMEAEYAVTHGLAK